MNVNPIDADLKAEVAAIAVSSGCELVHVETIEGKLRVFLDRPQGVTLDDCQTVSRQLSAILDVNDFGHGSYVLEVSSPGLDRELYDARDYERFSGRLVRVTFSSQGTKKTVVGRLEDFSADRDHEISVVETSSEVRHRVALREIMKAQLEVEL